MTPDDEVVHVEVDPQAITPSPMMLDPDIMHDYIEKPAWYNAYPPMVRRIGDRWVARAGARPVLAPRSYYEATFRFRWQARWAARRLAKHLYRNDRAKDNKWESA